MQKEVLTRVFSESYTYIRGVGAVACLLGVFAGLGASQEHTTANTDKTDIVALQEEFNPPQDLLQQRVGELSRAKQLEEKFLKDGILLELAGGGSLILSVLAKKVGERSA